MSLFDANNKIKLIAFDKNRNLQYEGPCKVMADSVTSMMLVQPKKEEFKLITASFKWNFVVQKNIIFVFAEHDFQDFCLVFATEKLCQRVSRCVPQEQEMNEGCSIVTRFMIPLFHKIAENPALNSTLAEIIDNHIVRLDVDTQNEYYRLMKENNVVSLNQYRVPKQEPQDSFDGNESATKLLSEMGSSDFEIKKEMEDDYEASNMAPKTRFDRKAKAKNYNLVRVRGRRTRQPQSTFELYENRNGEKNKKLIVFTSMDKKYYHKYYCLRDNYFLCSACRYKEINVPATLKESRNGKKYIQFNGVKHVCKPYENREKDFAKFIRGTKRETIPAALFELHENKFGQKNKKILVFTSEEKTHCYNFYALAHRNNSFLCSACRYMKKNLQAKLCKHKNGEYFLQVDELQHVCKPKKYDGRKYYNDNGPREHGPHELQKIPQSMFEFVDCGGKNKNLIVFTSEEKQLCYKFRLERKNYYVCSRCRYKNKCISARLDEDEGGQKFIQMNGAHHVCDPELNVFVNQN